MNYMSNKQVMILTVVMIIPLCVLISCTSKAEHAQIKQIGDTVLALGSNIMVVYQDKSNKYWFGSWTDGLYSYDGVTLIHYNTKSGFPDNRIEEIKEDKAGNIYFNSRKGVIRYNGERFEILPVSIGELQDWKLSPNDLWFKSIAYSNYVYRYDGNVLHTLRTPTTKLGEDYIARNPTHGTPYAVYCIYTDTKGSVWFGTGTLGAFRYNGVAFDWISEQDVTELHDGPANGVRSIIEDAEGNFWFNTEYKYGIQYQTYTPQTFNSSTFYNRIKSIGSLDGKKNGTLHEYLSVTKDNSNNLWFATYNKGVWKYDGIKIVHYPVQVDTKDITLFSIYKDNNGVLWLGTNEHGALRFNGISFEQFLPVK